MNNTSQLTFARFIAAISIVIYHFGVNTAPFAKGVFHTIAEAGSLGVSFFFTLSGFVMILAYYQLGKPCSWKLYMKNRVARILPLYYLAFILMAVYLFLRLGILKQSFVYTPQLSDIILNITLLQSWIPAKSQTFNTAAWSLSVEFVFYLIFPFLLNFVIRKVSFKAYTFFVFFVYILSQLIIHLIIQIPGFNASYLLFAPWLHINSFLMGTWFGVVYLNHKEKKRGYLLLIIALFSIYISLILNKPSYIVYHCGFLSILFGTIILFLASDNGLLSKIFKLRVFEFLGEISYGIYILQFPIYFFFTGSLSLIGVKMQPSFFYLYLVLLICISGFSYQYIEHPLRERIKSINFRK